MNMKKLAIYLFCILLLSLFFSCQFNDKKVDICRVENNQIIYRLDRDWNDAKIKEVSDIFGLDSVTIEMAYKGEKEFTLNGIAWKKRKIGSRFIDLSRPLLTMADTLAMNGFVFMISHQLEKLQIQGSLSDNFGINGFLREGVFHYNDGTAVFWLPGFTESSEIYLSGTFNNWSTAATAMVKADSGWVAKIKLAPGKYSYKYIIDGRWSPDPLNSLKEDDMNGDYNSVVYCPNYTFRIAGRREASDVRVTGAFLNWSQTGLNMHRTENGWILPIYLKEGTYSYKFITGDEWFTDPDNPDIREDGNGNRNSFITIGDQHTFFLEGYNNANNVILTGTFNDWRTDELRMVRGSDGWQISIAIPAGNYEYKFIVDGEWMTDPSNENTTGSGDFTNSFLSFKPNHLFVVNGHQNAVEVMVTGNFNNFSNPGYRMSRKEKGWILPVYLKTGKTIYKFIIDGVWMLDPANDLWEDNEFGTGNSVLWIDSNQTIEPEQVR